MCSRSGSTSKRTPYRGRRPDLVAGVESETQEPGTGPAAGVMTCGDPAEGMDASMCQLLRAVFMTAAAVMMTSTITTATGAER